MLSFKLPVPVNAPLTWQPMHSSGSKHSRTMSGIPFLPIISSRLEKPLSNVRESKKVKYLVIFDWDDTLFPATAFNVDNGKNIEAIDLLNLGKSVYELLEKYILHFGVENLCIVTNGKKSWVSDSLKMLSDLYQARFDGQSVETEQKELERDQDYFAAIYNTLISSDPILVISAQDLFCFQYPQVNLSQSFYSDFVHSDRYLSPFCNISSSATDHLEDESIQIDREGPFCFIFGEQ